MRRQATLRKVALAPWVGQASYDMIPMLRFQVITSGYLVLIDGVFDKGEYAMRIQFTLWISALFATGIFAAPLRDEALELGTQATVSVTLPDGGSVLGLSLFNVESFRGIPFAQPPINELRLKPPRRYSSTLNNFDATGIATACPQMFISKASTDLISIILDDLLDLPLLRRINGQEDCLTLTVQRPVGAKEGDKLPVLFWIFGGGFELGSTGMYDATGLLSFGKDQDQPFIFVAVNYRVGGFGFMPGAEILADGSANLGLLDQRMGLQWVADNIEAFGGDPGKVTIWGESAGAISVYDQMAMYGGDAIYKGKPLFRGAIMNSGTMVPTEPVNSEKGQSIYDRVVNQAGCASSLDTLDCLRRADYDTFLEAASSVPGIFSFNSAALSYLPRPDGKILPESPDVLLSEGRYHPVPMIVGDQEDEGTLFALFQSNLSSTDEMAGYLNDVFFSGTTVEHLTSYVDTYDVTILDGSPFRTGIFNDWYPGFKRLAAILGDLVFTLARRVFIERALAANPDVPVWSYLSSYDYGTPIMGTFHASDLLQTFFGIFPNYAMASSRTYYLNFLYNQDPNIGVGKYLRWPLWNESKTLLWFETSTQNSLLKDDFRDESARWISDNLSVLRV